MKMLIVDDNPRRYRVLSEKLQELGLAEDDISIVTSCMDARRQLEINEYDLLIVDIIVPLRAQDDPHPENSRDLLEELVSEDGLIKPSRILGLSADQNAADEQSAFFTENTWRIIKYDDDNDSWINQILNCVRYLNEANKRPVIRNHGVDVAIICALKEPELDAILRLDWAWGDLKPIDDNVFVYEGHFSSGGRPHSVTATYCTRMGIVSSAITASRLIEACRPRHVVMAGICGGVQGKVAIGQAILADPTWDWQSGKIDPTKKNNHHAVSPHQLASDHTIRAKFDSLARDKTFLRFVEEGWPVKMPSKFALSAGPMASGSSVLADEKIVAAIRRHNRDLVAIDMEAYGLYAAAIQSASPRPTAFAVKSVCDFANPDKNDEFQAYAAYTSAQTVREFLERFYADIVSES